MTIIPVASISSASATPRSGPTSTMTPSSTNTSPFGTSPMSGSIETTNPFRKTSRCELIPLSLAGGTSKSRQRSGTPACGRPRRAAGCTANITTLPPESQPLSGRDLPVLKRVAAVSPAVTDVRAGWTTRGMRSVTVDTSSSRCAEWTPGRGALFTVLPLSFGWSLSSPTDTGPAAGATLGRSGQLVASAVLGARFLPIWLASAALLVVAALFAPSTIQNTSWSFILPAGTILAIAAVGQMLVVMQAGIDLSTAGVISLCGNVLVGVSVGSNHGLTVGILVVLGLGALVGLANGILIGIVRLNPLIVTLAVGQIVFAYSTKYAREHTVSLQVPDSLSSWASEKPLGISNVFWAGVAVAVAVALLLRYSAVGRRFQAVGANPKAAWMAGLRVRSHVVFAYTAAGCLYAVAAILLAGVRITIDPQFGAQYLLDPIAVVVIAGAALSGGLASATSTWVAALALVFLTQMLLIFGLPAAWQKIVTGVAIIVGMLASGDRIASLLGRLLRAMENRAVSGQRTVNDITS